MDDMRELVGKTIQAIWMAPDESAIVFETDQGPISYEAWGDCCSETWFADITGVAALLGQAVASTEAIDLPTPDDGRTRQEEDTAYGVKLTTSQGVVDIIYRNSSNGYYGGSINLIERVSREGFRQISDDWVAGE